MPAFAPQLSASEIWEVIQFLFAQAEAADARALTSRVQPWRCIRSCALLRSFSASISSWTPTESAISSFTLTLVFGTPGLLGEDSFADNLSPYIDAAPLEEGAER